MMARAEAEKADRAFLGHPKGLGFLAFSEGWTAYSYYGMQSLLVLYMSNRLLKPGTIDQVIGFAPFHHFLELIFGPLALVATATAITGLYSGLNFLMPIFGGFIADRWFGRTRTVVMGAVLMTSGHFMMAFPATFLFALAAILVGSGCFNANLRAQIGELYAAGDERRADAFQIYTLAVNIAVIIAPIICGGLAQAGDYDWGFTAAGIGMALGLLTYLSGRKWLPREQARQSGSAAAMHPPLTRRERLSILMLIILLFPLALASVGNQQIFNAYLLWGEAHYRLAYGGHVLPVSWLLSLDASISTLMLFASLMFWRWWAKRRPAPTEVTKVAIGASVAAFAPALLALASWTVGPQGKVGLAWGIGFHLINNIGFANLYPVGLALYSRVAPPRYAGTMVSVYVISLFLASTLAGRIGGLITIMSPVSFWLMHSALIAVGAMLLFLFARTVGRILAPSQPRD